jgi:hypothetical protein
MAKLTLSDISNLADTTASQTTINANSALIESALENTVSRDGTSPNNMSGSLDMNGHSILNLTKPVGVNDAAREQDILDAVAALGVNADIITGGGSVSLNSQVTGVLPVANGGTGTATYTMGDILSSNSANALSKIPGNITATRKYLMSQGTGTIASPVQWQQVAGSDIAGAPLTKTDDTNVTLTLGGSPNVALLNSASVTAGWTGTLSVARGGTGASTAAAARTSLGNLREVLTANRTYFVRTDGNDSNTGLVNNAGGAFLTLTKAATLIHQTLDLNQHTVTVNVADGTYISTNTIFLDGPFTGGGLVSFVGNTTTPNNVVVDGGAGYAVHLRDGTSITFNGFKFKSTLGNFDIATGASVYLQNYTIDAGQGFQIESGGYVTQLQETLLACISIAPKVEQLTLETVWVLFLEVPPQTSAPIS